MAESESFNVLPTDKLHRKLPYSTPLLIVFGQVATLTRAATGCFKTDSASCAITFGGMGTKASDRNVKEDIVRIGDHSLGFGLYLFNYKAEYRKQWGQGRQFGVIAQEVKAFTPGAVGAHPDGYMTVDYTMLGIVQPV